METLSRYLLVAIFFMVGLMLTVLALFPALWDLTLPMSWFPGDVSGLRHGAVRGFVVALGLLNVAAGVASTRDGTRSLTPKP